MNAQAAFAACLLDAEQPCPPGLKTWNGSDPALRFAVYRNNVVASLVDTLAGSFPVTRALVGEDFFRAMARSFVQQGPPRSRVLARFGDDFADFIAGFPPAAGLPYLADLARLEMYRTHACHAADAAALDNAVLSARLVEPAGLADLRLRLHPGLHCLASTFAVFSLWAAHQRPDAERDAELAQIDLGEGQSGIVFRPDLEVLVQVLPAGDVAFFSALGRKPLGPAAQAAARQDRHFDLARALHTLFGHGLIVGLAARSPTSGENHAQP